ncbi:MAG: phosphoribosyltransferase family protein [Anaerolineae bacterium]
MPFRDRADAGRFLAGKLKVYAHRTDVIVLGLPRGGVPVAAEVARALHAPLDVFLVRKLGVPGREELAMGAIASGGVRVVNTSVVDAFNIPESLLAAKAAEEEAELARRERLYRDDRPPLKLAGRAVILVDDGLATGATMRAAIAATRISRPAVVVVAVPVAAPTIAAEISALADDFACVATPDGFRAVGLWYLDFTPTTDDEVRKLLAQANES